MERDFSIFYQLALLLIRITTVTLPQTFENKKNQHFLRHGHMLEA
jgi:hypothetical protein